MSIFFTPPFGLSISDDTIEVLWAKKGWKKKFKVKKARTEIPSGIIKDSKILNRQVLAQYLNRVWEKAKIKTRSVIFALPEAKTFSSSFRLPLFEGKELEEAIELEALSCIPYEAKEIYSDYKVIAKDKDGQDIFFVAALKTLVDDFLNFFRLAKFIPEVMEIESLALARVLINHENLHDPLLLADIGARTTNLTIFDQNGIQESVTVPIAGNLFTEKIMQKLKYDQKKAEIYKRSYGLNAGKLKGRIMLILQSAIQPLIQEAKKTLDYFEKEKGRKIKNIILTGGSSAMPGLKDYCQENFGVYTEVKEPLFGVAAGLAMRGMHRDYKQSDINLIQ